MHFWGEWYGGTWIIPSMVVCACEYKDRKMEQVNTLASLIDEWKVKDFERSIETYLNSDAQVAFARCMYGHHMEGLASECGGANTDNNFEAKNKTKNEDEFRNPFFKSCSASTKCDIVN